jgi:hypothetical protein
MKDALPYTGWIDDGKDMINADFIGGNITLGITKDNYYGEDPNDYNPNSGRYLVIRNTRTLVVIDVAHKRVVSEHYFDADGLKREIVYSKPKNAETQETIEGLPDIQYDYKDSFNYHGFDVAEGHAYRIHKDQETKEALLRVADVEMMVLFNRAL